MTQWHLHSKRKYTGGKNNSIFNSKKKERQRGSDPTNTMLAKEEEAKIDVGFGGKQKVRLKKTTKAFVSDPKTNKTFEAKIKTVKVNNANRLFVRRNIITKGAIIELEDNQGFAVVTSRPGQTGIVQAKLIEFNPKTVETEKTLKKEKVQKKETIAGKAEKKEKTKKEA